MLCCSFRLVAAPSHWTRLIRHSPDSQAFEGHFPPHRGPPQRNSHLSVPATKSSDWPPRSAGTRRLAFIRAHLCRYCLSRAGPFRSYVGIPTRFLRCFLSEIAQKSRPVFEAALVNSRPPTSRPGFPEPESDGPAQQAMPSGDSRRKRGSPVVTHP